MNEMIPREQLARNQELARMLMSQASSTRPIRHPLQGFNRLLQGINSQMHRAKNGQKTEGQIQGDFLAAIARGDELRNDFITASTVPQPNFRQFVGRCQNKLNVGGLS